MTVNVSFCAIIVLLTLLCIKSGQSDTFRDLRSQFWSQFRAKGFDENGSDIIPESDVRALDRKIWIITTACLPWMTGTSINPLLRAAYFAKTRPIGHVHLMVPWLDKSDQEVPCLLEIVLILKLKLELLSLQIAYPPGVRFNHPDEQREYVRNWLTQEAHLPTAAQKLDITFYAARYRSVLLPFE